MSKANERRQGMSGVRTSGPVLGGMLLLAAWFGWSSYAQWREDAIAQAAYPDKLDRMLVA